MGAEAAGTVDAPEPGTRAQPAAAATIRRTANAAVLRNDVGTVIEMPRPLVLTIALLGVIGAATPAPAQSFVRVERELKRAVRERVFPGATLVIGRRDTILYARGFGRLTWDKGAPLPSPSRTRYDLASLTKVLGTASVAARLAARGELDLERPVGAYVPCYRGAGRDSVTVRLLLAHASGLRAWLPLWRETSSAHDAFTRLCAEAPRVPPGSATEYSDLNAMLLGAALEQAGGAGLDSLVAREVTGPLQLHATSYEGSTEPPFNVAPTSRGPRERLWGRVNDENAERLGGVSGHAGLFGTALDVAHMAQAWL
ncbi:MAG TPA: serine hydrolase domain-containing protein, partial [Gemmatimonadales bacterium]|nr:serine hydrolase domain-containing protein [Gemmatimonadales bacterium]